MIREFAMLDERNERNMLVEVILSEEFLTLRNLEGINVLINEIYWRLDYLVFHSLHH